jgi:hypothetical protein
MVLSYLSGWLKDAHRKYRLSRRDSRRYADANNVIHGFLATPAKGDSLDGAGGRVNVVVAAAALGHATPPATPAVSAASASGASPGDDLGGMSTGTTTFVVTVPSSFGGSRSLAGGDYVVSAAAAVTKDPGATVDALFASTDDPFGSIMPI